LFFCKIFMRFMQGEGRRPIFLSIAVIPGNIKNVTRQYILIPTCTKLRLKVFSIVVFLYFHTQSFFLSVCLYLVLSFLFLFVCLFLSLCRFPSIYIPHFLTFYISVCFSFPLFVSVPFIYFSIAVSLSFYFPSYLFFKLSLWDSFPFPLLLLNLSNPTFLFCLTFFLTISKINS